MNNSIREKLGQTETLLIKALSELITAKEECRKSRDWRSGGKVSDLINAISLLLGDSKTGLQQLMKTTKP